MTHEEIRARILEECFNVTLGDDSVTARLLVGAPTVESVFFIGRDIVRGQWANIFCRMKPQHEITQEDFFAFTDEYLDRLIDENRIEFFN